MKVVRDIEIWLVQGASIRIPVLDSGENSPFNFPIRLIFLRTIHLTMLGNNVLCCRLIHCRWSIRSEKVSCLGDFERRWSCRCHDFSFSAWRGETWVMRGAFRVIFARFFSVKNYSLSTLRCIRCIHIYRTVYAELHILLDRWCTEPGKPICIWIGMETYHRRLSWE
jgi:hypothetical protein